MPIYSTRDLIPFVNQLEAKIIDMNSSVDQWDAEKYKLINASKKVDNNYKTAIGALVRADEALAEIGTATFKSTARRGKRLEDTLNELRNEMFEIAAQVEGTGGGGELTGGMFYEELNNAISSVDPTINDGIKLDYRLRDLQDQAAKGIQLSNKELIVAYKHEVDTVVKPFTLPPEEGIIYVGGDVTVLNQEGNPMLDAGGKIITGTIDPTGLITVTADVLEPSTLYFPVQMKLKDIPDDFLYLFMEQMVKKNSRIMETVLGVEEKINAILKDIEYMKGVDWTPDFSIMKNHQELVKEGITPKGLQVEVKDGMAHATFSYNDHPYLSHFVMERWDEETKTWIPYDGVNGIIQK